MWLVLRGRSVALLVAGLVLIASVGGGRLAAARTAAGQMGHPQPGVLWHVATTAPDVAVTFDDGPDPKFTPEVLRQLSRYNAVATFFVLGSQAERYPALVRAETAQGSEVCNHGWNHRLLRGRTAAAVREDVTRTAALLQQIGTPPCMLFRFPYFASDGTSRATVAAMGYQMIGANLDTEDWRLRNPDRMAEEVLAEVGPGDIILFHDAGGPRKSTVTALGLVLNGLGARHLRAVTVTTLLQTAQPGSMPKGK